MLARTAGGADATAIRLQTPPPRARSCGVVKDDLDERGYAILPSMLDADQCAELRARFDDDGAFRNTVVMERHGYGRGVYRYFRYPLPSPIERLRDDLYARLAPVANAWAEALGDGVRYPGTLAEFLVHCHANGQQRPTPLMLRYRSGDHNALHQDVYGDVAFPLQATVLLSDSEPRTSPAESSCWSSSARASRASRTSSRCAAAMPWCFRTRSARRAARAGSTGRRSATASARSAPASGSPSA